MFRSLAAPLVVIAAFCSTAGVAAGADRSGDGFLTSTRELATLGAEVRRGEATSLRRYHVAKLIGRASSPWPFGYVGTRFGTVVGQEDGRSVKQCVRLNNPAIPKILVRSGEILYAKALAFNLSGNTSFAKQARNRIMEFTDSRGFRQVNGRDDYTGRNECAREISELTPLLIESAILLESYPGWHDSHKRDLQDWLAEVAYPLTSALADTRKNNWGSSAAFASWAIGHYLGDRTRSLRQTHPVSRSRTPWQARNAGLESQLRIIGTQWKGDSRCERSGFQWHGGFPDELRRGSTGCDGDYLRTTDSSYDYQQKIVSHLVYHAEALKRHGNDDLYRYQLDSGNPLISQAIKFVVSNGRGSSHAWERADNGVLRAASHAYRIPAVCDQLANTRDFHIHEGRYMPYFRVIRGDGC